jgi:hypothetical protein
MLSWFPFDRKRWSPAMMPSRSLPFQKVNPKGSGGLAVMVDSSAFSCMDRNVIEGTLGASWESMQAIYQLALEQALASLRPRRSALDLKPSVN